ncbi:MAG: FtsQ-type POTRA domain-containing protein [Gudongella sp.]|jgi:cell division protein FtsQ|nr:FtsQ-type POTRA domain-containing protein [Gudongella sp.]
MMRETRVQKKKRMRNLLLRLFAVLAVIIALVFYFLKSSFFAIEDIEFTGNMVVGHTELLEKSTVVEGTNLLTLRKKSVVSELEDIPYVKEAKLIKKYPHKLIVEITERTPYLQFENGYSYSAVDSEGILLETVIHRFSDVTLIKGLDWEHIKNGDSILDKEVGVVLKDIFNDEKAENTVKSVKEFNLTDSGDIKLYLINGIMVEFGPMNNVKYKLKMLDEILADIEKKNIPTRMILFNKGEHPILVRED